MSGLRHVRIPLGERSYEVVVGHGAAEFLGNVLPQTARRAAVVTQIAERAREYGWRMAAYRRSSGCPQPRTAMWTLSRTPQTVTMARARTWTSTVSGPWSR